MVRFCLSSSSSSSSFLLTAQADSLPSSQPAETPVARLRRLQAEVAQLEAEMKAAPPASEPAAASSATVPKRRSVIPARQRVDVVTELSVLREKLSVLSGDAGGAGAGSQIGGVDWQARLARLELSPDSEAAGPTSRPSHAVPVASAGEVDKRLAALEQQVGVAEEGDVSYGT
jgi:nuclear migration protein JNM1